MPCRQRVDGAATWHSANRPYIGGLFLIVALAIERRRYKPVGEGRPDPRWTDTKERFVDPETGLVTAVYFDSVKGERHYLAAPRGTASNP